MTTLARGGLLTPETAEAIRSGLGTRPLRLPFECFYDDVGSALFDAITRLPEYGLSRAERRLLERCRHAIAQELALCRRQMAGIADLVVRPIEAAHVEGLDAAVAQRLGHGTLLVLFLGSNIGNFEPARAREFLCEVRARLKPGDFVLLGGDLVKPKAQLLAAYDDAAGVTAAFNRNALVRLNRELEADFEPRAFAHRALYEAGARRIEMHLVAGAPQSVRVGAFDLALELAAGEPIWTESSYKFLPGELSRMGEDCGFEAVGEWTDPGWPFALSLMTSV